MQERVPVVFDASKQIHILSVRFQDSNKVVWVWDLENEWLDLEYDSGEERMLDSGYPARDWNDVMEIMLEGGFIDGPSS